MEPSEYDDTEDDKSNFTTVYNHPKKKIPALRWISSRFFAQEPIRQRDSLANFNPGIRRKTVSFKNSLEQEEYELNFNINTKFYEQYLALESIITRGQRNGIRGKLNFKKYVTSRTLRNEWVEVDAYVNRNCITLLSTTSPIQTVCIIPLDWIISVENYAEKSRGCDFQIKLQEPNEIKVHKTSCLSSKAKSFKKTVEYVFKSETSELCDLWRKGISQKLQQWKKLLIEPESDSLFTWIDVKVLQNFYVEFRKNCRNIGICLLVRAVEKTIKRIRMGYLLNALLAFHVQSTMDQLWDASVHVKISQLLQIITTIQSRVVLSSLMRLWIICKMQTFSVAEAPKEICIRVDKSVEHMAQEVKRARYIVLALRRTIYSKLASCFQSITNFDSFNNINLEPNFYKAAYNIKMYLQNQTKLVMLISIKQWYQIIRLKKRQTSKLHQVLQLSQTLQLRKSMDLITHKTAYFGSFRRHNQILLCNLIAHWYRWRLQKSLDQFKIWLYHSHYLSALCVMDNLHLAQGQMTKAFKQIPISKAFQILHYIFLNKQRHNMFSFVQKLHRTIYSSSHNILNKSTTYNSLLTASNQLYLILHKMLLLRNSQHFHLLRYHNITKIKPRSKFITKSLFPRQLVRCLNQILLSHLHYWRKAAATSRLMINIIRLQALYRVASIISHLRHFDLHEGWCQWKEKFAQCEKASDMTAFELKVAHYCSENKKLKLKNNDLNLGSVDLPVSHLDPIAAETILLNNDTEKEGTSVCSSPLNKVTERPSSSFNSSPQSTRYSHHSDDSPKMSNSELKLDYELENLKIRLHRCINSPTYSQAKACPLSTSIISCDAEEPISPEMVYKDDTEVPEFDVSLPETPRNFFHFANRGYVQNVQELH